jgi:hypothetical protein
VHLGQGSRDEELDIGLDVEPSIGHIAIVAGDQQERVNRNVGGFFSPKGLN